jgi:hypothetical protein
MDVTQDRNRRISNIESNSTTSRTNSVTMPSTKYISLFTLQDQSSDVQNLEKKVFIIRIGF